MKRYYTLRWKENKYTEAEINGVFDSRNDAISRAKQIGYIEPKWWQLWKPKIEVFSCEPSLDENYDEGHSVKEYSDTWSMGKDGKHYWSDATDKFMRK
jgi:hypothetical protein